MKLQSCVLLLSLANVLSHPEEEIHCPPVSPVEGPGIPSGPGVPAGVASDMWRPNSKVLLMLGRMPLAKVRELADKEMENGNYQGLYLKEKNRRDRTNRYHKRLWMYSDGDIQVCQERELVESGWTRYHGAARMEWIRRLQYETISDEQNRQREMTRAELAAYHQSPEYRNRHEWKDTIFDEVFDDMSKLERLDAAQKPMKELADEVIGRVSPNEQPDSLKKQVFETSMGFTNDMLAVSMPKPNSEEKGAQVNMWTAANSMWWAEAMDSGDVTYYGWWAGVAATRAASKICGKETTQQRSRAKSLKLFLHAGGSLIWNTAGKALQGQSLAFAGASDSLAAHIGGAYAATSVGFMAVSAFTRWIIDTAMLDGWDGKWERICTVVDHVVSNQCSVQLDTPEFDIQMHRKGKYMLNYCTYLKPKYETLMHHHMQYIDAPTQTERQTQLGKRKTAKQIFKVTVKGYFDCICRGVCFRAGPFGRALRKVSALRKFF
jgi:hypothetical protein